jgi:hypothetical protein
MTQASDLAGDARRIIDANRYLTLASADADGRPWATPVWFAPDGYTTFVWCRDRMPGIPVTSPAAPNVGIVIFDSTVPVGGRQAVYVEALAEQVPAADLEPAIATYSHRSKSHGAGPWRVADVIGSASHRLYRAEASAHYLLVRNDARIPVDPNAT